MQLTEAVLKSLEDIGQLTNYMQVYKNIKKNNYYDFKKAKTPTATVSSLLGNFIRNGDARVKRIKQDGETYLYYLTKNEKAIGIDTITKASEKKSGKKKSKSKNYTERSLHKLLCSYLKVTEVYSKTIFHEQSTHNSDNNQTWTHPDMVGIKFLNLQSKISQHFLKSINRVDAFKISSYEIKREINNDSDLKKAFFQAVSNSSWANYGYLVAFEFSDSLNDEIARLNQLFGIGIIELKANPYQSRELFSARYKDLDFKTIDKLCKINKKFESFIEKVDKLLIAADGYEESTEKEFEQFCDDYFNNDAEVEEYCKANLIPFETQDIAEI